jgi:uncharacterized membrane protein YkvI
MVCCVFQATNLVNNYGPRKSARTFESMQEASNKLYTVLAVVILFSLVQIPFLNLIDRIYSLLAYYFQK